MKANQLVLIFSMLSLSIAINGAGNIEQTEKAVPFNRIINVSKENGEILVDTWWNGFPVTQEVRMSEEIIFIKHRRKIFKIGSRENLKPANKEGVVCPNVDKTGHKIIIFGTQSPDYCNCKQVQELIEKWSSGNIFQK